MPVYVCGVCVCGHDMCVCVTCVCVRVPHGRVYVENPDGSLVGVVSIRDVIVELLARMAEMRK